ncbi:MAG: SAM-dependent methyltransferase, partial [Casimicrobiaceae bacterium]
YGRPSNPAFLLEPGELLERVHPTLVVVGFEQGAVGNPPIAVLQRVAAVGRGRVWPPPLAD